MPGRFWDRRFEEVQREIEGLIQKYFGAQPPSSSQASAHTWAPPADLLETRDNFIVRLEIAGVVPEDVCVTVSGEFIEVSGVRRLERLDEEFLYHRAEIIYGAFSRQIRLGAAVDRARTTATYKDGFLEIVLPKSAAVRSGEVQVEME